VHRTWCKFGVVDTVPLEVGAALIVKTGECLYMKETCSAPLKYCNSVTLPSAVSADAETFRELLAFGNLFQ
jgi:hypothetical protein